MFVRNFLFAVLLFVVCSCSTKKELKSQKIIQDDLIITGNINPIYNGFITFHDLKSGVLVQESFYENGRLNGISKTYNEKGSIKEIVNYKNDTIHGNVFYYDTFGILENVTNFFYGLRVGPSSTFRNGILSQYTFYSFDNIPLYSINYDSINTKSLAEVNDGFFLLSYNSTTNRGLKYIVFNVSPPKYKCNYYLVKTNKQKKVLNTIDSFDIKGIWFTFFINEDSLKNENEYYAIQLRVIDSINNKDFDALKLLKPE